MLSKELDKALDRLSDLSAKHARLSKELENAKSECQPLTQICEKVAKLESEYEEARDRWRELDSQFDDEHAQLVTMINDALNEWYEEKQHIREIIRNLTEVNNG